LVDQLAEGIISLAQRARKQLEGRRRAEAELERKIRTAPPNSTDRNHWERNLRGIQKEIADILRRNKGLK